MESDFGSWFEDLTRRMEEITRLARVYTQATAMREFCQSVGRPDESDVLIPKQHASFVMGEKVRLKYADFLTRHRPPDHPNLN